MDSPAAPAAAAAAQLPPKTTTKTNMSNKQIQTSIDAVEVDVIACLVLHSLRSSDKGNIVVINNISNVRSTVNGDTIVQSNLVGRLNENPESVDRNIHGACFRFHHGSNGVGKQLRNSYDGNYEQYWCQLVDEGECYKVLNKIFEGIPMINDSSLLFEDDMIRRLRMFMDIMFDPTSSDNTRVVEWIGKQDWVVPVIIPQNNGGVKEESESVDAVKQFLHTSPDRNLLKRFVLLNFARLSGVFFAIS